MYRFAFDFSKLTILEVVLLASEGASLEKMLIVDKCLVDESIQFLSVLDMPQLIEEFNEQFIAWYTAVNSQYNEGS